MAARALSQAQIDAIAANGRDLLRKERAAKASETINLGNLLALGEPIPLPWGDRTYLVKPISFREGVRLQRTAMDLARFAKKAAETPEEIDALTAFAEETVDFFWSLLAPKPALNPFADVTPQGVAYLLDFFSRCLTRQASRSPAGTGRNSLTM